MGAWRSGKRLVTVQVALALTAMIAMSLPAGAASATRDGETMPSQYLYLTEYAKLRHEAELGNPDAVFQLGVLHYDPPPSSGIAQSYRRAFVLFFEAALRGQATAQHNVGAMYWNGDYVAQSVVEGYAWFLLAASHNDPAGLRKRKLHEPDLDDKQREAAQARFSQLQQLIAKAESSREYSPRHYGIE